MNDRDTARALIGAAGSHPQPAIELLRAVRDITELGAATRPPWTREQIGLGIERCPTTHEE